MSDDSMLPSDEEIVKIIAHSDKIASMIITELNKAIEKDPSLTNHSVVLTGLAKVIISILNTYKNHGLSINDLHGMLKEMLQFIEQELSIENSVNKEIH